MAFTQVRKVKENLVASVVQEHATLLENLLTTLLANDGEFWSRYFLVVSIVSATFSPSFGLPEMCARMCPDVKNLVEVTIKDVRRHYLKPSVKILVSSSYRQHLP